MFVCCLQNYLQLVEKRDRELVSLAMQLGMEGFKDAATPFSPETVRRFLSETGKRVRGEEEKAKQEKVGQTHNISGTVFWG